MNKISIIIPTLNEEDHIETLLEHLIANTSKRNIKEIIVVDGGSNDNTVALARSFKEATLINSPRGRAKQMNLGARQASGSVLYFLHADSLPPKHFDTLILNEIDKGNLAGCFKMKFNTNHWWLKLAGWFTQFSWRIARGGDQSQFITTALFNSIGGFNEDFKIYEDNDLIAKLYKRKQFVVIQEWLITSSRRYKTRGMCKLQYHYWNIHLRRLLGADAQTLNKYYLKYVLVKK
ncbi:TIGR04283 family arsenosugar biosynthesis glycosyltransferase [Seonamhaeicola sp. ML3]|uniref:TIGR04283 family arsenosugar biosynthesis glycosyltransferase n=1 Tax=Seonamhaeicola sp. ML3 TaxID=2937786 RepID=UPI00200C1495|nr:TIGR04283 family arsenosugar biosynthesis glycosyltransferase [Seonamhaeicola sp. ML3]